MAEGQSTALRGAYQPFSATGFILAAVAGAASVVPARTGHKPVITRIVISITTVAAQIIAVKDTASTPLEVAALPASAAIGVYTWDFGVEGLPCTEAKGISIVGTAGPAYAYVIEGYYKQTAVMTMAAHAAS